jgi:hypothetical protein
MNASNRPRRLAVGPLGLLAGALMASGCGAGTRTRIGAHEAEASVDASTDAAAALPDGAIDAPSPRPDAGAVVTVPLAGCYDTHTLRATIGTSQTFDLNLDTGASSLGVASQGCASCEDAGVSPLYQPGGSAMDLSQPVTLMYASDFGWSGEAYRDAVSIGGLEVSVNLAAITSQTNYFSNPNDCDTPSGPVSSPYQGTIGFGPDAFILSGTNDYIDQAVAAGDAANVFSISFCHLNGTLWIGGYDPTSIAQALQYTSLGQDAGYTVEWTDVIVDGVDVALPSGTHGTVDSGGDYLIVPASTYTPLAAALAGDAAFQKAFGSSFLSPTAQPQQNCVMLDQAPAALDAALPPLVLKLGNADPIEVPLTATQSYLAYFYGGASQVTYCQNIIAATPGSDLDAYLGQSLMLGHVLVYDRAHSRFGVAPAAQSCPF